MICLILLFGKKLLSSGEVKNRVLKVTQCHCMSKKNWDLLTPLPVLSDMLLLRDKNLIRDLNICKVEWSSIAILI